MHKVVKKFLIGVAVAVFVIIAALPVVVPPVAECLIRSRISGFGLSALVRMSLGYCWRNGPGIDGHLKVALLNSPWSVSAEFGCSCCEWSASVTMPETRFDETDIVLRALLERVPVPPVVSNLAFSGTIALDAKAERTFRKPVPVWSAKLPIRDLSVSLAADGKPAAVTGLSVMPAASGIADHLDIAPIFLRAKSLSACGFDLTGFNAAIRATEKSLLVTEASAEFCGGQVNLYSLHLNPQNLNAGFTLFLDEIDAGQILAHLNSFRGKASGRLHGKIKLFVREGGKAIRLRDAFLYSIPGETGKIKLSDPTPITDNLALAGLDKAARDNIANALGDLDYSVLRLDLTRGNSKNAMLSTTVRGTATRGDLSVPVDITINFNGALEQIINTGLGYSNLMKGKIK